MASYFGKHIHVSIFGQSHSEAIGVAVDGLPAGEAVDLEQLQALLPPQGPRPGRHLHPPGRRGMCPDPVRAGGWSDLQARPWPPSLRTPTPAPETMRSCGTSPARLMPTSPPTSSTAAFRMCGAAATSPGGSPPPCASPVGSAPSCWPGRGSP